MDADESAEAFLSALNPAFPSPVPVPVVVPRHHLVRPDVAVVVQALASAGLKAATLDGPGLLLLTVPDAEWQRSVAESCMKHGALDCLDGPPRFALHRVGQSSDCRSHAFDALAVGSTAVLVDVAGSSHVSPEVLRAVDARLHVKPLSWEDCQAVAVRLTCDARPTSLPAPANLSRMTPASWTIAYRSWQTADELLLRVIEVAGDAPARPGVPVLRLADSPGLGEASAWGADMADDLRSYANGELTWADLDRGALLYGPPGCGKTRFAACLAGSAGVPLVASSVTDWSSERSGSLSEFLSAMRAAFARAKEAAPCILFIDELDAIGLRGQGGHNASWTSAAVAGLLEAMDGADRREGVVVIAATNDVSGVEPALRRSGRLDRCIEVGMPDAEGLAHILRVHLGGDLLHDSLSDIAAQAVGGTGADVERWVREARRRARVARRPLELDDLAQVVKPAKEARPSIGFGR